VHASPATRIVAQATPGLSRSGGNHPVSSQQAYPSQQLIAVVRGLEGLAITLAIGAHVHVIARHQRGMSQQQKQHMASQGAAEQDMVSEEVRVLVSTGPASTPTQLGSPLGALWLTLPLLVALGLRSLHQALTGSR
jgi:hypothetical protein